MINVDVRDILCKENHKFVKDYIWNLPTCSCKNGKYLTSTMDIQELSATKLWSHTTKKQKHFQQIIMKKI